MWAVGPQGSHHWLGERILAVLRESRSRDIRRKQASTTAARIRAYASEAV
jgi:hypothetical protein